MENPSNLWQHCCFLTISFSSGAPSCSSLVQPNAFRLARTKTPSIHLLSPYKVNPFRNPLFPPLASTRTTSSPRNPCANLQVECIVYGLSWTVQNQRRYLLLPVFCPELHASFKLLERLWQHS